MSSANTVAPREHLRHLAVDDLARQALRDRGLADAGIADQQRIVLLPAAQHLDRALHLGLAADQRIDPAVPRLLVEVYAVSVERAFLFLAVGVVLRLLRLARVGILVDAARAARRVGEARALGDAVADVIDRVVARHVLLLQEIGGVALALGEDRDQHVGAGHLLAARRLDVDRRALHDALEAGGRLRLLAGLDDEVLEFGVDVARRHSCAGRRDRRCTPRSTAAPSGSSISASSRCSSVAYSCRRSFAIASALRSVFSSAREKTGIVEPFTSFP